MRNAPMPSLLYALLLVKQKLPKTTRENAATSIKSPNYGPQSWPYVIQGRDP